MGKQTGFYYALAFIAGFLLAYLMGSPSPNYGSNYVNDLYEGAGVVLTGTIPVNKIPDPAGSSRPLPVTYNKTHAP